MKPDASVPGSGVEKSGPNNEGTGSDKGTGEAGPETSAQAATLHQASASIHTIADHMPGKHPEFVRGVRYAATLLGHTATDLEDGE